jgi:(S)-2-hydroxyglutarate dehydrogenase
MKEIEPNVNGISAIKVPMAGIVNYKQVSESYAKDYQENGGELKLNTKVVDIREKDDEIEVVQTMVYFTRNILSTVLGFLAIG